MSPTAPLVLNQRHLAAELDVLCDELRRHAERLEGKPELTADAALAEALARAEAELARPSLLDALATLAGLSPFERRLLLLCVGVELSSSVAALCARIHGDPRRAHASASLALAVFADAHLSALTPDAPLRRLRLVEVVRGDGLLQSALRCDERVVFHLIGLGSVDERLRALVAPLASPSALAASHQAARDRVLRWLASEDSVAILCGDDLAAKRAVAASACEAAGVRCFVLRASALAPGPEARELLTALWEREAFLGGAVLLVEHALADGDEALRGALQLAARLPAPLLLALRDPVTLPGRATVRIDVPLPTFGERRASLATALGPLAAHANGSLDRVVAQFRLIGDSAFAAAAHARGELPESPAEPQLEAALWTACRAQTRPRLDDLAQRIDPRASLADLVLPEHQRAVLGELAAQARHRAKVHETWGFEKKSSRGLGISALFSGPSGTGKTMAAEALACALQLDLYRIDLSQVVSKYIGETEKNLRRVFDAADESGCVLLFDEADALFGKRGEVKDSHDRYANIEVSYLLQRMESYRGLALLTTNLKDTLDTAFLRRIRFVIPFPFPDAAMRAAIWRRAFPDETPTEGLDPVLLGRLAVAGGNIRNIAIGAAFLAADRGEPVRMAHVLRAARREYEKLERALTEIDLGGAA